MPPHAHLIAQQIDSANTLADLQPAAELIEQTVRLLHASRTPVEAIAQLVTTLNRQLFSKLWTLLAPPELVANSCLLVMGSEGRGEQILRTDQDNALLLRDGFEHPATARVAGDFSAALLRLGWPPCPGRIMLNNPLWQQSVAAFNHTLRHWAMGADNEGPMHLAIFLDAVPVAGDPQLLHAAQQHLAQLPVWNDISLARFAAAADQFQEPGHWWTPFTHPHDEPALDLKKIGLFPIVHGARALYLQYGLRHGLQTGAAHGFQAQSTVARLEAVAAGEHLAPELAHDLVQALHSLMQLRLNQQLAAPSGGKLAVNGLRPSSLGEHQRQRLNEALASVSRFRLFLRLHFQLEAL